MNQYLKTRTLAFGQAYLHQDLRSRTHLRARLSAVLVMIDILALFSGFSIGSAVRFGSAWSHQSPVLVSSVGVLYGLCALVLKAYSRNVLVERPTSLLRALAALLLATVLLSWMLFLLQTGDTFSRIEVSTGALASAMLLVVGRTLFASHARKELGGELDSTMMLRDGTAPAGDSPALAFDVSSFFDPHAPSPEAFDRLAKIVGKCDRVIVECSTERRAAWAQVFQGMNVHAEVVAPEFDVVRPLAISSRGDQTTLVVARGPLGLRERLLKRAFDFAFALVALLISAPLLLFVAIAIKLDSAGPVFFMQPRIGRQNKQFRVFKFRSMYVNQNDVSGTVSTARGDLRVTRIGRFIRATSIDELPQLFNVLKGEMSVVGPRPHAVHSTAEEQLFWDVDSRYWSRHACKPGITGLAQIKGLRGATHCMSDLRDRVTADLEYANNWSLWGDIVIVLRTATVLLHRNAY